ncbi:MAG: DUF6089 family protein [Bacteroidota bacterium]
MSRYKGGLRGYGRFRPYYYLGLNVNAANYFGDLAPVNKAASTDVTFTRPGFGIHGGFKFHHSIAVRGELNWYRVFGDDFSSDPSSEIDRPRYLRNLSFRNDIKEFQAGVEIYLFPNYGSLERRLVFNGYLFVGAAVLWHEPNGLVPDQDFQDPAAPAVAQAGEWVRLRPLQTEGVKYGNIDFSIPLTLGATFAIPRSKFNAGIEFGVRFLFTDYIDDVSTNYKALDSFTDPLARILSDKSTVPVSATGEPRDLTILNINQGADGFFRSIDIGSGLEGSIRGNPDNNDLVFVSQIKLTYLISRINRGSKFR